MILEVTTEAQMAKSAQELMELIVELEAKDVRRAYELLRAKCISATEDMIKDRSRDCLVDLTDKEVDALDLVTAELRDLGYKFRFIERQTENGTFIAYKLLISIQHCE